MFETTGRRLHADDFIDESQSEGDEDVILDDILGYNDSRITSVGINEDPLLFNVAQNQQEIA